MECLIANKNKNLYIKIDKTGRAITCGKAEAQKFHHEKATNLLKSLPKTLRQFKFSIIPINDAEDRIDQCLEVIHTKKISESATTKQKIKKDDYVIPDGVNHWISQLQSYSNIIENSITRKNELYEHLSNVDKELSNCLHEIELNKWKSGSDGYKEYKKIKLILERRREIKDELSIVKSISETNRIINNAQNAANRLQNRDFTIREIDQEELEAIYGHKVS